VRPEEGKGYSMQLRILTLPLPREPRGGTSGYAVPPRVPAHAKDINAETPGHRYNIM